jgi:cell wall assembly regulator SMI1
MMKELTWFEPGEPLAAAEIESAEMRLGVKFPSDYAQVVASHSGGSNPDESEFEYLDKGRKRIGNFGTLLSLNQAKSGNLFEAIENLGDQLPAGVIPVMDTGSGDCVCLDYRKSPFPSIIYFVHERVGEDAVVSLTGTFAEFLDRLKEPDEGY